MSTTTDATQTGTKRIGARLIPFDRLRAHPLNANRMPAEYREKLGAHIRRTGRYPFVVVRPHPDEPDAFEILDGHHRVSVLAELGHDEARCDVWDVDDREAKLLLATLNRLEGQDVPIRRAELVHELLGEWSMSDLAGMLPETDAQIEELQALLQFPADDIAAELAAQEEADERVLPRVMTFVVTPEQEEVIERAVDAASDGTPGCDRKARGLAILAQQYLESTAESPDGETHEAEA